MATSYQGRLGTTPEEAIKAPCVAVSDVNLTLSGEQTVNGVAVVSGDRVLVIAQTTAAENAIYNVSTSTWSIAKDWNDAQDVVSGQLIVVPGYLYQASFAGAFSPGVTDVTFTAVLPLESGRTIIGSLDITGNASPAEAGHGQVGAGSVNGLQLLGNGETYDTHLANRDGFIALAVIADTQDLAALGAFYGKDGFFTATGGDFRPLTYRRDQSVNGSGVLLHGALKNSADEYTNYSTISTTIVTNTDGAEDGRMEFFTIDAGTELTLALRLQNGDAYLTGSVDVDGVVKVGANPATAGNIRLSNDSTIRARNAANTGNITIAQVDSSDNLIFDSGGVGATFIGNVKLSDGTNGNSGDLSLGTSLTNSALRFGANGSYIGRDASTGAQTYNTGQATHVFLGGNITLDNTTATFLANSGTGNDAQFRLEENGVFKGTFVWDGSAGSTDIYGANGSTSAISIDGSANVAFGGTGNWGSFSSTGASDGTIINSGALIQTSRDTASSIAHYQFYNTIGIVGSITTDGAATGFNTSSDPRLKSEFVELDTAAALEMVRDSIEKKYAGVFTFKSDPNTPVAGYNAHALLDNQLGFGGSEGEGPRDQEIGSVYQEAKYEQEIDDDGELLFDDIIEVKQRQMMVAIPVMEDYDHIIEAVFIDHPDKFVEALDVEENPILVKVKDAYREIITPASTEVRQRQVTKTELVDVEETTELVGNVLKVIKAHQVEAEVGVTEVVGVVDESGNPVMEDYDEVTGKTPRMIEVLPELRVTPGGVDQSKRVPLLEAAIYELLKKVESIT